MTIEQSKPAPLTPGNCDLQDFAFMPLDVQRLRDSELASNETPEACWAAVLLWAASWHQIPAASIPNDDMWIAKQAGYQLRGKIDKAWKGIREGALRGWVECSDGRLYHPVVAEKAVEAWQAKLKQRWGTECARIKKHNDRHEGANVPKPTFEEWIALGCPTGHTLPVPRDNCPSPSDVPRETASKRQGEGQGQGETGSVPNGTGAPGAEPGNPGIPADRIQVAAMLRVAREGALTEDEEKLIWNGGLAVLLASYDSTLSDAAKDAKARMFIGGLGKRVKTAGADRRNLFDVIQGACMERPLHPESWMSAALANRLGKRAAPNRQEAQEQRNQSAADDWAEEQLRKVAANDDGTQSTGT